MNRDSRKGQSRGIISQFLTASLASQTISLNLTNKNRNMNNRIHYSASRDIFIRDASPDNIPEHPVKIFSYIAVLCHSGEARGKFNIKSYSLSRYSLCICTPGQIWHHQVVTDDFRCTVLGLSPAFVGSLGFPYNYEIVKMLEENPIIAFNEEEYIGALKFQEMIDSAIKKSPVFQLEIIRHLTCAAIYGFAPGLNVANPKNPLSAGESIVNKFFSMLKDNYCITRTAQQYAEELCVSPGYLASVIKRRTGKTVSEWIAGYVILEAKALLQSGDLSIQQISHRLNFPNQSFFGKYFKKHTGITPSGYRLTCMLNKSTERTPYN